MAATVSTARIQDLRDDCTGSRIPKATPVFLTYVMLKKSSITEIVWLRSIRLTISHFVQRSRKSTKRTRAPYGILDLNFDVIGGEL
jgi:hypothetical protein